MEQESFHRRWLDQFDPPHRGWIGSLVYDAARREKSQAVGTVAASVRDEVESRLSTAQNWNNDTDKWEAILPTLSGEAFQDFIMYVLWKLSLPAVERAALKAERGMQYAQAAMTGKEPTEKQLALLKKLGYSGNVVDRASASGLIAQLLKR